MLLAARKAELAKEDEEVADEELDALARESKPKKARNLEKEDETRKQASKEKLGKGVSILCIVKRISVGRRAYSA